MLYTVIVVTSVKSKNSEYTSSAVFLEFFCPSVLCNKNSITDKNFCGVTTEIELTLTKSEFRVKLPGPENP